MTLRTRAPSIFRPPNPINRVAIKHSRALVDNFSRRKVLRGALTLGALTLLTGCDVRKRGGIPCKTGCARFPHGTMPSRPRSPGPIIWRQLLARRTWSSLRGSTLITMSRMSSRMDGAAWKLELAGLIADKRPWTAQQLYALPEQEILVRHICVEGWDYIGQWSGPSLRGFLTQIGADLTAKYVYFICNDDFTESIDMPSALHPQTILATRYAGDPIADPFGYPLRLRTAVKLGYKNAKWIKAIEVTNTFRETFWSKQGENWFAGI